MEAEEDESARMESASASYCDAVWENMSGSEEGTIEEGRDDEPEDEINEEDVEEEEAEMLIDTDVDAVEPAALAFVKPPLTLGGSGGRVEDGRTISQEKANAVEEEEEEVDGAGESWTGSR